jgi:hypothetical protein
MVKTPDYRKTLQASASAPFKPPAARPSKLSRWHAVSIARGTPSCAAAARLDGRRWLSAQAPQLPVEGCDVQHCDCRYRHHDDRRGKRRRQEDQGLSRRSLEGERRSDKRGRRENDD